MFLAYQPDNQISMKKLEISTGDEIVKDKLPSFDNLGEEYGIHQQ